MNIRDVVKNPVYYALEAFGRLLPRNVFGDSLYLRMFFRYRFGRKLDLKNPQTYNEKLQWLKLYDRKPEYTKMVDKHAVKEYVAERIGEEHIIPTLGVWDRFEDIDFDALPDQFVLKCTHDSGGLIICTDKAKLDIEKARKTIGHAMKRQYYVNTREWPYKDVPHRIIAEQYMVDESGYELKDYKFFVFDGRVEAMFIATGRNDEAMCFDFFDREFCHMPIKKGGHPNTEKILQKPQSFSQMIEIAEELGKGIPHVRVDLYSINNRIYFGEMTFFSGSGFSAFSPEKWDYTFGDWIHLPS